MTRRFRYAPADWQPNVTRVTHPDMGVPGTFVGNSFPNPDASPRGWLGVLIRFDDETKPLDVDPTDLEVVK